MSVYYTEYTLLVRNCTPVVLYCTTLPRVLNKLRSVKSALPRKYEFTYLVRRIYKYFALYVSHRATDAVAKHDVVG